MLTELEIKKVLLEACSTGADFAELYFENTTDEMIRMTKDEVDNITRSNLYGVGLRILKGTDETYGYSNDISFNSLMKLASDLNKFYQGEVKVKDINFNDRNVNKNTIINKLSIEETLEKKISHLKILNKTALNYDKLIVQSVANLYEHVQNILVCNTLGVYKEDARNNMRYGISVVAENENGKQQGLFNYGGNFGLAAYDNFDFEALAIKACKQAITMLKAPQIKGGIYDVVINNDFGGVIFHEACGHALEASSVARGLSVFTNKLGKQIASTLVTAIDDGTIPNEWGSLNIDDEGHETKKNVLIENGILKSYMIDYKNSLIMNMPSTGSGRRQSYRFKPTSRMTNTYIANGTSTFDEIIQNTKYGLFAKELGGGSVNPVTGEFNFAVNEGYLIEDGKITTPVRGATLIGKGDETLLNIDMIANNQTFGYGMCGASSGSIPACVGQPTIRVKNMTVGGNGGEA